MTDYRSLLDAMEDVDRVIFAAESEEQEELEGLSQVMRSFQDTVRATRPRRRPLDEPRHPLHPSVELRPTWYHLSIARARRARTPTVSCLSFVRSAPSCTATRRRRS